MGRRQAGTSASHKLAHLGSVLSSDAFTKILRTRSQNIRNLIICALYFLESFKLLFSSSFQMKITSENISLSDCAKGKKGLEFVSTLVLCFQNEVMFSVLRSRDGTWNHYCGNQKFQGTKWRLLSLGFSLVKPWR